MAKTAVGIDVAKLKFDVAVWIGRKKFKTKVLPNTPAGFTQLLKWLNPYGACHICLEATGSYSTALATFLADNGIQVSVENPARIHAFGQSELSRNKTDQGDAKMIALYCAMHTPALWAPAPLSERQLTALVRHLGNLEEMKRMQENRQLVADEVVQPSLTEIIAALKQQIKETKQKIRAHIANDPDLKKNKQLLESIPGIGEILSCSLLAYAGDMSKFSNSKEIVAYAGLNPKLCESGLFKGRSRISKTGHVALRKAVYMPALAAISCNAIVKAQWGRLVLRHKGGKIGICAAMRKLLQLAYGVLKSGMPFDAKIALAS
ncbi:IS110 family transposase [unidentified bacterial endosymbiont]|uniref:IS110 family transposase n=1 Tax=unidentified bacterial endosymbiont TaxID=2355 RepID=UPI00209D86A6|nr:IS110 family transposase [unidentified bacterial endosymbiont]